MKLRFGSAMISQSGISWFSILLIMTCGGQTETRWKRIIYQAKPVVFFVTPEGYVLFDISRRAFLDDPWTEVLAEDYLSGKQFGSVEFDEKSFLSLLV